MTREMGGRNDDGERTMTSRSNADSCRVCKDHEA